MNDEWNYNNKAYLQFLFYINQKMTNKILLLSLFTFSISSCYMNKTFLTPQKMASDSKSITIRDSMVTYYSGENFQPTFNNSKNNIDPFSWKWWYVVVAVQSDFAIGGARISSVYV